MAQQNGQENASASSGNMGIIQALRRAGIALLQCSTQEYAGNTQQVVLLLSSLATLFTAIGAGRSDQKIDSQVLDFVTDLEEVLTRGGGLTSEIERELQSLQEDRMVAQANANMHAALIKRLEGELVSAKNAHQKEIEELVRSARELGARLEALLASELVEARRRNELLVAEIERLNTDRSTVIAGVMAEAKLLSGSFEHLADQLSGSGVSPVRIAPQLVSVPLAPTPQDSWCDRADTAVKKMTVVIDRIEAWLIKSGDQAELVQGAIEESDAEFGVLDQLVKSNAAHDVERQRYLELKTSRDRLHGNACRLGEQREDLTRALSQLRHRRDGYVEFVSWLAIGGDVESPSLPELQDVQSHRKEDVQTVDGLDAKQRRETLERIATAHGFTTMAVIFLCLYDLLPNHGDYHEIRPLQECLKDYRGEWITGLFGETFYRLYASNWKGTSSDERGRLEEFLVGSNNTSQKQWKYQRTTKPLPWKSDVLFSADEVTRLRDVLAGLFTRK